MADTETATLEPVVADTVVADEPTLPMADTLELEGETETDDGLEADTETFTKEQLEEAKREAVEAARAEAQREAEEQQRTAEKRQVEQAWQDFAGDFGLSVLRQFAAWGAKQAERHSPEEVHRMVEPTHAKEFLNRLRQSAQPYLRHEVFTELSEHQGKLVDSMFPDWKPSRETSDKYRDAVASGDAGKASRGLLEYLRQAIEESEVPKKVKELSAAELAKQKKAQEVSRAQKGSDATGPAKVGGVAGRTDNRSVLDTAHPLSKEYAAAYKAEYGIEPPKP